VNRFFDRIRRLDEILASDPATVSFEEQVRPLLEEFQARRYFYSQIRNPAWLPILRSAGEFDSLPAQGSSDPDGSASRPVWLAGWPLPRLAATAPEAVMEIVSALPETGNSDVHSTLLEAARAALPGALGAVREWVAREAHWIRNQTSLDSLLVDAASSLAVGFCPTSCDSAFELAKALLELLAVPGPDGAAGSPKPRMSEWLFAETVDKLRRPLVACDGHRYLRMVMDLLVRVTGGRSPRSVDDKLVVWRPAVEENPRNTPETFLSRLVAAVRDTAVQACEADEDTIWQALAESQYSTFRRVALHLGRVRWDSLDRKAAEFATNPGVLQDRTLWHELFVLLEERFAQFPEEARSRYLAYVAAADQPPDKRRLLLPVRACLTGEWLALFERLSSELPELAHASFAFHHATDFAGPRAGRTAEGMREMPVADLVGELRAFTPTGSYEDPSPEGWARELARLAAMDTERITRSAGKFIGVDPTYVRGLAQGLDEALRTAAAGFEWEPVLTLCSWALDQPRETGRGSGSFEDFDASWEGARLEIGRLLESGLRQGPNEVPAHLLEAVWSVLGKLLEDPDPAKEEECQRLQDEDPSTIALNTVRGVAIEAALYYALRKRRPLRASAPYPPLGDFAPEVRGALEEHLDSAREHSLAIHSVYGKWFPQIYGLDKEWALTALGRVFPSEDERRLLAAWHAYLAFSRVYIDLLPALRPLYEMATRSIGRRDPVLKTLTEPDERLGGHLLLLYRHGAIGLDDGLLTGFFSRASDELRYSVLADAVSGIQELEEDDLASVCSRLMALWAWRLAEAGRTSPGKESTAFCWWFIKKEFDSTWALNGLLQALEHGAALELDGQVLEKLEGLAASHLEQVLQCLKLIIEDERNRRWGLYDNRVKAILRTALSAEDEDLRDQAEELVHLIGKQGFLDFKELLWDRPTRPVTASGLGRIGGQDAVALPAHALRDKDPGARGAAERAKRAGGASITKSAREFLPQVAASLVAAVLYGLLVGLLSIPRWSVFVLSLCLLGAAALCALVAFRRKKTVKGEPSSWRFHWRLRRWALVGLFMFLVTGAGSLIYWSGAAPSGQAAFDGLAARARDAKVAGQLREALSLYEQALALARQARDRPREGISLDGIASVYYTQGKYDQALAGFQQALVIRREVGDRAGEGATLNNIAGVYQAQGKYDQALTGYQQALVILREVGDRAGEGATLNNIAGVYQAQGKYDQARTIYEQALVIARELGMSELEDAISSALRSLP